MDIKKYKTLEWIIITKTIDWNYLSNVHSTDILHIGFDTNNNPIKYNKDKIINRYTIAEELLKWI